MSTRDELGYRIAGETGLNHKESARIASELIAEGWRKKPSGDDIVEELLRAHYSGHECGTNGVSACSHCYGPSPMSAVEIANLLLALMDRGQ